MPLQMPEFEAYASNGSSMSDYCKFTQAFLLLRPMEGVDLSFDLGIEHDDSGPSDGACCQFILYADNTLLRHSMMKKNLQPE